MSSRNVSRRDFIENTAFLALGLPVVLGRAYPALAAAETPAASFTPPKSLRTTLNFNYGWKFLRDDAPGAEAATFDDSTWNIVATPHSFNDVDSFRMIISHGGGDRGTYKGLRGTASISKCRPQSPVRRCSWSSRECVRLAIFT